MRTEQAPPQREELGIHVGFKAACRGGYNCRQATAA